MRAVKWSKKSAVRVLCALLVAASSALLAAPAFGADPVPFAIISGTCENSAPVYGAPVTAPHSHFLARYTVTTGSVYFGAIVVNPGDVVWAIRPDVLATNDSPRVDSYCDGSVPFTVSFFDEPATPAAFGGVGTATGSVIEFDAPAAGQYVADVSLNGGGVSLNDGPSYDANTGLVRFASSGQYPLGTLRAGHHELQVTALDGPRPNWVVAIHALPVAIDNLSFERATVRPGVVVQASYTATGDTSISAVVRSANGKTVKTLASALAVAAGEHTLSWDGTDDDGRTLPDGRYTLTLSSLDPSGQTSSARAAITLAAPAPQEKAAARGVTARFYYTKPVGDEGYKNLRLQILRGAEVVLNQTIPPWRGQPSYGVQPAGYGSKPSVSVRDLDGDRVPEVSLLLYWGGAHCCSWSRVYRWDNAAKRYRVSLHFWSDFEPKLADLDHDGKPELTSADARFGAQASCFGCTYFPIQIWSYRHGVFRDTTRRFPRAIKADAGRALRAFLAPGDNPEAFGNVAAWAAGQALLGQSAQVHRQLVVWAQRGMLHSSFGPTDQGFVTSVWKLLQRTGYLR